MARVGRGRPLDRNESLAALIGYKVRQHREARGWTQEELGDRVGYTGDQISKIERGERVPADKACEVLDEVLETDEYFQEHAPHARRESVSDWMKALVDYEATTSSMSVFHQFVVHGLLQDEEYARAMLASVLQGDELDEAVARRMDRQAILRRADPPWLEVLLTESAIRNVVGSPEIMRGQLARILEDMDRLYGTVQIIPDGAVYLNPFSILTFDHGPDLVYAEVAVSPGQFYNDKRRVQAFKVRYSRIRSLALPVGASATLVREVMEQMS
jgi:transcriptional regulator with XRE-family HTH domain